MRGGPRPRVETCLEQNLFKAWQARSRALMRSVSSFAGVVRRAAAIASRSSRSGTMRAEKALSAAVRSDAIAASIYLPLAKALLYLVCWVTSSKVYRVMSKVRTKRYDPIRTYNEGE